MIVASDQTNLVELPRRRLLERFIAASGAVLLGIAVLPGIGMILGPVLGRRRMRRAKLLLDGGLDRLGTDFVPARYEGQADVEPGLFVRKTETGELAVFSAQCTHGGCALTWSGQRRKFLCPCHKGVFDAEGKVVSGPPPRPLARLAAHVEGPNVVLEVPEA